MDFALRCIFATINIEAGITGVFDLRFWEKLCFGAAQQLEYCIDFQTDSFASLIRDTVR